MVDIETRIFGKVSIGEDRVINFANGILGFPDLKRFTLLHDVARGSNAGIHYLQSIDEPGFAMPVMNPMIVRPDYNPKVQEEYLAPVGDITKEETLLFVTLTVPGDVKKMTVNLRAPIIINVERRTACQLIAEGDEYDIKYAIYDIVMANRDNQKDMMKKAGE